MNTSEGAVTTPRPEQDTYERAPEDYIGRDALRKSLLHQTQKVRETGKCRLLYVMGPGGMGKTRMLREYVKLVSPKEFATETGRFDPSELGVCELIDLIDQANREPLNIELQLIHGLRRSRALNDDEKKQRFDDELINRVFKPYFEQRQRFDEGIGAARAQRMLREQGLHEVFITCWNELSSRRTLVVRLDTMETLFLASGPQQALIETPAGQQSPTQRTLTINLKSRFLAWAESVFGRLKHTLILAASRPVLDDDLIRFFQRLNLLGEPAESFHRLEPFTADDAVQYLNAYKAPEGDEALGDYIKARQNLPTALAMTEGRPLLLTSLARLICLNAFSLVSHGAPEDAARDMQFLRTRIVEEILDPSATRHESSPEDEQLAFCLCILADARRGISIGDLRELLVRLGTSLSERAAERLQNHIFVKVVPISELGHKGEQPAEARRLTLLDEVWLMIDQSGLATSAEIRSQVLPWLVEQTARRVRECYTRPRPLIQPSVDDDLDPDAEPPSPPYVTSELDRAMADHLYYELTYDPVKGYRIYSVYVEWLLRQYRDTEVLVLADVFWGLMALELPRADGVHPAYLGVIHQSDQLRYDQLLSEELVRRVWLYLAQERYAAAEAQALACLVGAEPVLKALAETIAKAERDASGTVGRDPVTQAFTRLAELTELFNRSQNLTVREVLAVAHSGQSEGQFDMDLPVLALTSGTGGPGSRLVEPYDLSFFFNTCLVLQRVLSLRDAHRHTGALEVLHRGLDSLLTHEGLMTALRVTNEASTAEVSRQPNSRRVRRDEEYLHLRRRGLHGLMLNAAGYAYRLLQRYDLAIDAYARGLDELCRYESDLERGKELNEFVTLDIAQVQNNYAFAAMLGGRLPEAVSLSSDIVAAYGVVDGPDTELPVLLQALLASTHAAIHVRRNSRGDLEQARRSLRVAEQAQERLGVGRARGLTTLTKAQIARMELNNQLWPLLRGDADAEAPGDMHARFGEIDSYFKEAAELLGGESDQTRDVTHERARLYRDWALATRRLDDDPDQADEKLEEAAELIETQLRALPPEVRLDLLRADLQETRATIALNAEDYGAVDLWLAHAEDGLRELVRRLPNALSVERYAHVVSGKITLQRSLRSLFGATGPLDERTRREVVLGLALALSRSAFYAFSGEHHDGRAFAIVIEDALRQTAKRPASPLSHKALAEVAHDLGDASRLTRNLAHSATFLMDQVNNEPRNWQLARRKGLSQLRSIIRTIVPPDSSLS